MIQFLTHIRDKKITNPTVVRKYFSMLKDGCYQITIRVRRKRSLPQNSYFHGVMLPLVFDGLRDAGFDEVMDHEDAKLIIKNLFLKVNIVSKETGLVVEHIRKTSSLSTTEFNELIDQVIKWAAEYLMIQIPYPNEDLLIQY